MHRMLSRRGCHRIVDFVTQWISSRSGFRHAMDVVTHRMLLRRGCCRAVDFIAQWMSRIRCCHVEDVIT
jgi:predicted Fe-S protein YdhL (DUF1289 family)